MSLFYQLNCPLDQLPLEQKGGSLVCSGGHTFDLAKSGYVNLLPVQNKHSKDPGDSKEMVLARHNFLSSRAYEPIASAIAELIDSSCFSKSTAAISLLDAGCGDGYYLSYLQEYYGEQLTQSIGLDISKWAVMAASKHNKKLGWVVGSNASLPMPPKRFHGVLCLFGFPVWHEFNRVLKDDGFVLLANAGANHLIELREILYHDIHPHTPNDYENLDGFIVEKTDTIQFQFAIESNEALMELVRMTPHLYKASYKGKQELAKTNQLRLTVDVSLTCLRKKNK